MNLLATILSLLVAASPTVMPASGTDAGATSGSVDVIGWEVVSRRPHDADAFTQGLQLDGSGRLFESTGLYGASTLRQVDPRDGRVLRQLDLPDDWFGEGLALVGEDLVQLTWNAGTATRRDADTFELLETFSYAGQGWGLCFDGERLVMSDGSDVLTFRDADTFEVLETVAVTFEGQPLSQLNELECVDDAVWANVWYRDLVVRIDPADGRVTGVLDLAGILEPHPQESVAGAVLNGIAWDPSAGTFLVTGKRWPELIEIRLLGSGG